MSVELPNDVLIHKFCYYSERNTCGKENTKKLHAFKLVGTPEINDKPQLFPKTCFRSLMVANGSLLVGFGSCSPSHMQTLSRRRSNWYHLWLIVYKP